jgi:SMC interacting uncharacterized protein involved in chromosome segregation
MLDNVPDEFYKFVRSTTDTLVKQHQEGMERVLFQYKVLLDRLGQDENWCRQNRGKFAAEANNCKNPSYMYSLLDGNMERVESVLWDEIRPEFARPFLDVGEEI